MLSLLPVPLSELLAATVEHIDLCLVSLALACGVAFPLGVWLARKPKLSDPMLTALGALYTIPSLAMLAILVPLLGLGRGSAIVALVLYAQFILLHSVILGMQSVDRASIEAAQGLGLSPLRIFTLVEAPMAMPVWISGLRHATLSTLSIATTAAWIHAGGLGTLIFEGLSQNNTGKILAGAVLISALALCFDTLLKAVENEAAVIAAGQAS